MIDDGGSAFPITPTDRSGQIAPTELGMSLRDYFAAQALTGLLSDPSRECTWERYATHSYQIADAMLTARIQK